MPASQNDITGQLQQTKRLSNQGRENFDNLTFNHNKPNVKIRVNGVLVEENAVIEEGAEDKIIEKASE